MDSEKEELAKRFSGFTGEVAEWLSRHDAVDVFKCFVDDEMDVISALNLAMSIQTNELHGLNGWNEGRDEQGEATYADFEEEYATTVLAMIRLKKRWLWFRTAARKLYGDAVTDIEMVGHFMPYLKAPATA